VILSVFVAYLLDPLVKLIRRPFKAKGFERLMPRPLAIVVSFLIVFSFVGLAISYVAPLAVEQGREFTDNLPNFVSRIKDTSNDVTRRFQRLRLPPAVQEKLNEEAERIVDLVAGFFTGLLFGGFILNAVTFAPWLVLVPILAFFFLNGLRTHTPPSWRKKSEDRQPDIFNLPPTRV
jgi:predicted PurR-regulated permease PerM